MAETCAPQSTAPHSNAPKASVPEPSPAPTPQTSMASLPEPAGLDGSLFKARKWDVASVKDHRIFYLLGRRGSGKTTLLNHLLYHFRDKLDVVIAMSGTMDNVRLFETHMPPGSVYSAYDGDKLEEILDYLQELDHAHKPLPRTGIILDDCMWDKAILNSKLMRYIHLNGRHLKITFFNCVQYLMDCPTWVRTNIDYLFAFWDNNMSNRENLHKFFFGMLKKDEFEITFRSLTGKKRCIVLDSTEDSADLSKQIYHFRANPELPPYVLGSREFWKYSVKLIREVDEALKREKEQQAHLEQQLQKARDQVTGSSNAANQKTQPSNKGLPANSQSHASSSRKRRASLSLGDLPPPSGKNSKQPRFTGVVPME